MPWAPDYCTAAQLADFVQIDDEGELEGADTLALAVSSASRAIDTFARRQFGKVDALEARRYLPRRASGPVAYAPTSYLLDIDDLATATGLLVDGVAADPLLLAPPNAVTVGRPYTRIGVTTGNEVTVTGTWGWPAVPDAIVQACLLQASRFYIRRFSPYGVAGSPTEGSEIRLLSRLDPDVAVALRSYTRRAVPR
jgi:hypothetical protein